MEGVEDIDIDLATGRVRVALTADCPATENDLIEAIRRSGFTLVKIEMPQ